MKIGFIGAAAVAQSLARGAIQVGRKVVVSARRGLQALWDLVAGLGQRVSDAVQELAQLEWVMLAAPWVQVPSPLEGLHKLEGRILADAPTLLPRSSRYSFSRTLGTKASEFVAAHASRARVVKMFYAIRMERYDKNSEVS
ncbi:NAD(P)-binding domain-containing protein [Paraburkholderia sp. SIMBA_049]